MELLIWAFILSLAFYPEYYGFLAWFALARPIHLIGSLQGKGAYGAGYFFSFFFTFFSIYWVGMVTIPGMLAAVIIVAFYYSLIWFIFNRLYAYRKFYGLIAFPFLWVGLEYFRSLSEFAFPWFELGYTQAYYLTILQIVSIVSVHGLTFLVVIVNVLIAQMFRMEISIERKLTAGFISAGVIALLIGYGWAIMPPYPEEGKVEIALLQGSIPINVKWQDGNEEYSYSRYDTLSQLAKESEPLVYVWPETSAPTYLTHDARALRRIGKIAKQTGGYHLVGALGAKTDSVKQRYYNSCYQFTPDGEMIHRYDKVKLVPFSEHVPYQDYLPFLEKGFLRKYLTFIESYDVQWWSDFYPGKKASLFEFDEYRAPVLICFESTFPEYVREYVLNGADFLIGTTNDTWFGQSVGIHMHARIFLTRAVENRSWGARIANSGITYIVNPYGNIRKQLKINEVGVLTGKVGLVEQFSFYTRYGDIIGHISFLITVSLSGILALLWILRKFVK